MYVVKEMYCTLQGEGAQTGRAAVFLRFTGCNLWSGREQERASAICRFCDTDFIGTDGPGGGRFATARQVAAAAIGIWPGTSGKPLVVCTGGEPLLQLDAELVEALHTVGFEIAIETNGTLTPPAGIDWVTVSPKAGSMLVLVAGDELKLVYPQEGAEPEHFEKLPFTHYFLQPMDGPERTKNTREAVAYCLAHPQWRLSVQTHKFIGIA